MSYETLTLTHDGPVATLTLNRPAALNSFTREMWAEFRDAVRAADSTGETRVLIVASTGKHFTAGMDLSVFATMPDMSHVEEGRYRAEMMRTVQRFQETFTCLEEARFPVIAVVQGGCIGAGVDLISACDMRYCASDAFFCIQEINIGMTADVGTFPRLQKLMPEAVVREMAYTGCRLPAERALSTGLVNAVGGSADEALTLAKEAAQQIASKSPLAIWGSKEMLNYGRDNTTENALKHIATWQAGMFQEGDIREAMTANVEKRTAEFDDLLPDKDVI